MEENKNKVLYYFKKYGYYAVAFVLLVAITLTLALTIKPIKKETENVPTETQSLVFGLPINSPNVLKWYSETELMYNETLKQWEAHKGIDMVSKNADDNDVFSVLDGVVSSIEDVYEYGTVVKITHDDGFTSVYYSLDEKLNVNVSDKVKKGDKIGVISSSATSEQKAGKHLHFELYKDGVKVDPSNYISFENK